MNCRGKLLAGFFLAGITFTATAVTVPATLIRDYPLLDSPNGLLGGPPVTINPNSSFTGQGLAFGIDAGPRVSGNASTSLFNSLPVSDYSIAFDLTLDSPSYQGVETTFTDPFTGTSTTRDVYPIVKLIDFKDLTVDAGLYINDDGVIEFRTLGTVGTTIVQPDRDYHFAFTRDRNNGFQAYLDGTPQFAQPGQDTNSETLITSDSLAFLLDDNETTDPMAAGLFSFLEIYEGTLTDQQVASLAAASAARAVPAPASLLLVATCLLLFRRRRVAGQTASG